MGRPSIAFDKAILSQFFSSLCRLREELEMGNEDHDPHFDFNFQKIREYWKVTLGSHQAAQEYLRIVARRLGYWLQERGSWIDFEFATKHLEEDLALKDIESQLTWLALRHRVQLANEQQASMALRHRGRDADGILIEVKRSSDGRHDAVWHEIGRAHV
jgi:hypothetical protein